jgi:hypothetical protein
MSNQKSLIATKKNKKKIDMQFMCIFHHEDRAPPDHLLETEQHPVDQKLTTVPNGFVCCMDCEEYFKPRKGHFGKDYCLSCIRYFSIAKVRTDIKSEFETKDTALVELLHCTDCKCIVSSEGLCDKCDYKQHGNDGCYENDIYTQFEEEEDEEEWFCCYICAYGCLNVGCVRGLDTLERE